MVIPHLFCMDEIHVVQRICLQVLKKIALLLHFRCEPPYDPFICAIWSYFTFILSYLPFGYIIQTHCSLTHWGRVRHICIGKLTIIVSDNGLSPDRHQAIIWTNAGILLIGPPGTNFNEILIEIHMFSFKKIHLKMSFGKWRPFCLSLNGVMEHGQQCFK